MSLENDQLDHMAGRPWIYKVPPRCPQCGYNLTGLTSSRCPECGATSQRRQLEQNASEVTGEVYRLQDLNDVPKAGLRVAIVSGAMMALAITCGFSGLGSACGAIGGFLSFGLGLSILRTMRVPREALELLKEKPNYALGVGVGCLGALLIALSIIIP